MATLKGWKFDFGKDTKPCIYAADISEGNVLTVSDYSTTPVTVAVAGAGEMPVGVAPTTLDISEDGAQGTMVVAGLVPILLSAAVTDATIPLKAGATGTGTPCDTNNDKVLGMPQQTCANSTICLVDLKLMGTNYGV